MSQVPIEQPLPGRLWSGASEAIFGVLPRTILANFSSPGSENALLWNLIYPRAQPYLQLGDLMGLKSLWGTANPENKDSERLIPYFWGYDTAGSRLEGLDGVLAEIDGPGPKTEIDLFMLGPETLIAVEGKHSSGFGRCSRYGAQRCPEIHSSPLLEESCRYWDPGPANFPNAFDFGLRPEPEIDQVHCNTHYQLARTYVIGRELAHRLGRAFGLWAFIPATRWRALEKTWLDFAGRVSDDRAWRWLRVIAWEQLQSLPVH